MTKTMISQRNPNPSIFDLRTEGGRLVGRVMAPGHRGRKTWTASRLQGTDQDVRRYATGFASRDKAVAFVEKGVTS